MSGETVSKDELIDDLVKSDNEDDVIEAIDMAAEENGIDPDGPFSQEEVLEILDTITESDDVAMLVGVAANTTKAQYHIG